MKEAGRECFAVRKQSPAPSGGPWEGRVLPAVRSVEVTAAEALSLTSSPPQNQQITYLVDCFLCQIHEFFLSALCFERT